MRFRVLGTVELLDPDGSARPLGSSSQRRLLAALLARSPEVVPVDTLVDAVWGAAPPATAIATLRTHVSRLRPLVAGHLATKGSGYQLTVDRAESDAACFEDLLLRAERSTPGEAVVLLDEALGLWRGPAFGDEADVPGVRAEARRLEERRGHAVELRGRALLDAGRAAEAVAAAEALVEHEPLREGAWAVLVEGLARTDRSAEALRAFQRAAVVLADAGLEPSPRLRRVEQGVLDGSLTDHPIPPAAPPTPDVALPTPVAASSFVGRDADRQTVVDLLDTARVVTLVGPGGVGKTRLALEVAHLAAPRRALGAKIVELAALTEGEDVPAAVVAALGLATDQGSAHDTLARAGTIDVLVVLDNAEHVIDEVARTVEGLVSGGTSLRVLATSRERLGVDGEHVWMVAPLSATGPEAPGCELFVERARAVVRSLDLSPHDEQVARIVRRLDGLPLAIEMAAAQLAIASLDELAEALDQQLDGLRSPRRDVAARHRSLAAVLAWSEERLDDDEASVLAELAVFSGPVGAHDITGVLGRPDAADITRSLATRSLVDVDRSHSPVRFQLLFTVRDFAARKLAGTEREAELAAAHASWFLEVAQGADEQLRSPDEATAQGRIEGCFAELRAAHRWARTNDPALAIELSLHLHHYAYTRLADEPLQWAEALADQRAPDVGADPVLLTSAATRALTRGDLGRARPLAELAVEIAGRSLSALAALEMLGDAAVYDGRLEEGITACRAMAELAEELGDSYYLAAGAYGAVLAAAYAGRPGAVASGLAELDGVAQRTDLSPTSRGWLAYTRGELLSGTRSEVAFDEFDEALALARVVGNRFLEGVALVSSCSLRARVGDIAASLSSFGEAIRHWDQLADRTHQLTTLRNLGVLFQRAGEPAAAAELLGAVERPDVPTYGEEAARLEDVRAWAERQLGAARASQLAALGLQRDVRTAAAWALAVIESLDLERSGSRQAEP